MGVDYYFTKNASFKVAIMAVLYAFLVVMDVHMSATMVVLMKCNELSACIDIPFQDSFQTEYAPKKNNNNLFSISHQ